MHQSLIEVWSLSDGRMIVLCFGWCNAYTSSDSHIHAYRYSSTVFVPENHENRVFLKYGYPLKSSGFCQSWKKKERKTQQTQPFQFFPRVAKAFVPELTEATFGCVVHARKTEICRFALGSVLQGWKTQSRISFPEVSQREQCICEAASQIGHQNQGAICKNVSCTRQSVAESIDHAHAKPSPAKRRGIQTFKRAYHEKWRERWHLCELWTSQYSCEMIGVSDSRACLPNSVLSCAELVREVHSVDCPVTFL